MPKAWSRKDERQYEHVKESELEKGRTKGRAKEIAARTVNKQRREEGRTKEKGPSRATGNPNTSLEERTVAQLRNVAADAGVKGRSGMRKSELIRAIRRTR